MDELELNNKIIKANNLTNFEFEKVNDDRVVDTIVYRVDNDITNSEYCLRNHWYDNAFSKMFIEGNLMLLREAQSKGYKFVKLIGSDYKPLTADELDKISNYIDDYLFVSNQYK